MSVPKQSTNKSESQYSSPFSTGGGGYRFEWLVATYYMLSLIRNEIPLGMDSFPEEIRLQTRNQGNSIDDVTIYGRTEDGLSQALHLQVKHRLTFSNAESNHEFPKVIGESWNQIHSPKFTRNQDRIGFAIGDISNTHDIKITFQTLLNHARSSCNGVDLFSKIQGAKALKASVGVFEKAIHQHIKRHPAEEETWYFLKHPYVIPFDFTYEVGFHWNHIKNACVRAVSPSTIPNGQKLLALLYNYVSSMASQGGTITRVSLKEQIPASADLFSIPSLQVSPPLSLVSFFEKVCHLLGGRIIIAKSNSTTLQRKRFLPTSRRVKFRCQWR